MGWFCPKYFSKIHRITRAYSTNITKLKPPWCVLFFGTDDFSVASLRALNEERLLRKDFIGSLEIVTRSKNNPVRLYAEKNDLVVHDWPLCSPTNCHHIGIVVSFGHLIPREVIDSFPMGMLNVHASLLPRWRGAAPIVYAIANGDKMTGVSVMRVRPEKFDIGEIVKQEEVRITEDVRMPQLHETLAHLGAKCLAETIRGLPEVLYSAKPQSDKGVTLAPRVNTSLANVNFFEQSAKDVYNLARALTGLFPLVTKWNSLPVKLYSVTGYELVGDVPPGSAVYVKKLKIVKIGCLEGCVLVDSFGIQNKKVNATDFNNGYIVKQKIECRVFR